MTQRKSLESTPATEEHLLSAVAEHMKQPLLYVRQAAELAENGEAMSPAAVRSAADAGLLLIEHFLTWQRYEQKNADIALAQIGLTAVMHQVTEELRQIAKLHQTSLKLTVSGKYGPVVTDSKLLAAGLSALGLAFIEASPAEAKQADVVFGVHKTRWGIVAGVYSATVPMRSDGFMRHKNLTGSARQLMPLASHAPMSGIAIADALFSQLSVRLRPARHKKMDGLAVTLAPSPQLSLL